MAGLRAEAEALKWKLSERRRPRTIQEETGLKPNLGYLLTFAAAAVWGR
jgi:hypothetical protein